MNCCANRSCKDLRKEDLLGMNKKYNLIKAFIEADKTKNLDCHKLIALYGEWGSGKSSIFNTLKEEINEKSTSENTILVFNAWEVEHDKNLELSLLEFITHKIKRTKQIQFNIQTCEKLLKTFSSGLHLNAKVVSLDIGAIIEKANGEFGIENSYYSRKERFKKAFSYIVDEYIKERKIKKNEKKTLVICIDELDRCEPENVLNLLSTIKHLYMTNENVKFICGIDRDAIKKALMCKYDSIIKSEEYLEKIFDISFTMPDKLDVDKLIQYYIAEDLNAFNNGNLEELNYSEEDLKILCEFVINFFKEIKFTNPRKLKKVLNKYRIYKMLHELSSEELKFKFDKTCQYHVVFVLYSIILHEIYPKKFDEVYQLDKKIKSIIDHEVNDNKKTEDTQILEHQEIIKTIFKDKKILKIISETNSNNNQINTLEKIFDLKQINKHDVKNRPANIYLILILISNLKNDIKSSIGKYPFGGDFEKIFNVHEDSNEESNIQLEFCKYIVNAKCTDESLKNELGKKAFNLKELFDATKFLL